MAEKLKVEWAVQNKAILDALDKVSKSLNRTEKAAERSAAASKRGSRQSTSAMEKLGGSIVAMGASYIGATQLARAFTEELEKQARIQKAAAQTERTLQQNLADIGFNIGGENIPAARQMIRANAPDLGVSQEGLGTLLGEAISAGAKDLEEALGVATAALNLTVGDAEKASVLIQGALDIADFQKTDDFKGALGQVSQMQRVARGIDPAQFLGNIRGGLATATAGGFNIDALSSERGLEIASIFSQVLKDSEGTVTKTALVQFIAKLDGFVPQLSQTLKDGSKSTLTQQQIDKFKQTRSVDERVQQFQANEALGRQFLDVLRESQQKIAISTLVRGTRPDLEQKAADAVTDIAGAGAAYEVLLEEIKKATKLVQIENRSKALIQQAETEPGVADIGQARELFTRGLAVNLPGLDMLTEGISRAELLRREAFGQEPVQAMLDVLNTIRHPRAGESTMDPESLRKMDDQILLLLDIRNALNQQNGLIAQPQAGQHPANNPVPAAGIP